MHGDEESLSHEHVRLQEVDMSGDPAMGCVQHEEQIVAVAMNGGDMVALAARIDCHRVQAETVT